LLPQITMTAFKENGEKTKFVFFAESHLKMN
jgi:uncharacterized protein YxeA